jgi:uncharacterized protein DUF4395
MTRRVPKVASGSEPVDARADRAAQGAVTVIALGAFVFHVPLVIPVLAVILGVGAARGPTGNLFLRGFDTLVAPRLSPPTATVPADTVQAQDLLGVVLLGLATLCILIGLGGLGSIVTLAEAGVAVVAATTGLHLGVTVRDRIRRK